MKNRIALILVFALIVSIFASCGGTPAEATQAPATDAPATAAPATAAPATVAPATATPEVPATPKPTSAPVDGAIDIDLSTPIFARKAYDAETGYAHVEDKLSLGFTLPYPVPADTTVRIIIKAISVGDFRMWLGVKNLNNYSDQLYATSDLGLIDVEIDADVELTTTESTSDIIIFRGESYDVNIEDLTITSLQIVYPEGFVPPVAE